jgi:hypothetical protein
MTKPDLVYSFTSLNTYEKICRHQMYRRYIKRDIRYVESPQMRAGNAVHTAFEHRCRGGKPLPLEMQQWEAFAARFDGKPKAVEAKLGVNAVGEAVDFFATDVRLRGKVDLFCYEGNKGFIADWKTGSSRFEDPFELEVQALLLRAHYPAVTDIYGAYAWLKDGYWGETYGPFDLQQTGCKIAAIVNRIEANLKAPEWAKNPGPLCAWCDVLDCQFNRKPRDAREAVEGAHP